MRPSDDRPAVSWGLLGLVVAAWSGALVGFAAGVAVMRVFWP